MERSLKARMTSILLCLVIVITAVMGSTRVYAAESADTNSVSQDAEVQQLRNRIDQLISENSSTRETYKTDYWGEVTFTDTNIGAWHTIYGHQARMAVAFKPVDGNTALTADLDVGFGHWQTVYHYNSVDADGYYMFVSDWKNITYQGVYRMIYKIWTTGGGYLDGRRASFHVWVDYK